MKLKLLSNKYNLEKPKVSMLCIPNEILEYILNFCDLQSLLQVRLSCLRLSKQAEKGIAKAYQLDWRYCLSKNISPLELVHCHPSEYLEHLTVPIVASRYASNLVKRFNLKPEVVENNFKLNPESKLPLFWGVSMSENHILGFLDNGDVFSWRITSGVCSCDIFKIKKRTTSFKIDHSIEVNVVSKQKYPFIVSCFPFMDAYNSGKSAKSGVKMAVSNYHTVLALEDTGRLFFLSEHTSSDKLSRVVKRLKVKSLCGIREDVFGAILDNGDVYFWGGVLGSRGVNLSQDLVNSDVQKVKLLKSSSTYFVMLLEDEHTVVLYGFLQSNMSMSKCSYDVGGEEKVDSIYCSQKSCLLLLKSGKLFFLGYDNPHNPFPSDKLENQSVEAIYHTETAFAVQLLDGTALSWGSLGFDGDSVISSGRIVKNIISNLTSFTAVFEDDTFQSWGCRYSGGVVPDNLKGCRAKAIFPCDYGFLGFLMDGSIYYWGSKTELLAKKIDIPEGCKVQGVSSVGNAFLLHLDNDKIKLVGFPRSRFSVSFDFDRPLLSLPPGRKLLTIDSIQNYTEDVRSVPSKSFFNKLKSFIR